MGYTHNPYFKLIQIDLTTTDTVASGGTESILDLDTPAGFIDKIVDVRVNIPDPVGSTAGSHNLKIYHDGIAGADPNNYLISIASNTGTDIAIKNLQLVGNTELPSNARDQFFLLALQDLFWSSNSYPVRFRYYNNTDANQTGSRVIICLCLRHKESV